jgi:hypothetical protein
MKSKVILICNKILAYFLMVLILIHSVSCKYYKVDGVSKSEFVNILNMGEIHKYFIVHAGSDLYALNDIEATSQVVSGNIANIENDVYYNEERKKRIKEGEKDIVNEVHIYLKEGEKEVALGFVELPLSDIEEIRIIDRNTGKEIAVYALIGVGALVIISAVVAATKSSCPYAYSFNGENFVFEGETYGGAIGKNLEREDYMPLPSLKMVNGNFRIRMSNELKERQYTNLLELIVVEHLEEQKVLLDKTGAPQLVANSIEPILASSSNGEDIRSILKKKDAKVHFFNNQDFSKNEVVMKFKKPREALNAKLVLNCKNTLWFDYQFGEFIEKFGAYYSNWMSDEASTTTNERMQRIIDSDFPLFISVKKNGKWEMVDYLLTVGPLAPRDFVIPLDDSEVMSDNIEIKLETGFMFWELDYAGMDFSENTIFETNTLKPYLAYGTGSKDWKAELEKSDDLYMAQENIGDVTELVFIVPDRLQYKPYTAFLKTQGYYELIRDFDGLPEWAQLKKFKEPGHFSDFSRENYLNAVNIDYDIALYSTE